MSRFLSTPVIHHGPGALSHLQEEIDRLKGQRVGLITDRGLVAAGVSDAILQATEAEIALCDAAEPEPSYELVADCVAFLREHECDLVIGLGGGSSMDVAKMSALMEGNDGDVSDYWGAGRVPNPGLSVIAIPTTAGTGSEVSPAAVFVDRGDGSKKGVRSDFMQPAVAILDPELTLTLPQPLTASTGMDALTHAIEAYTAPQATRISDMTAERSIALVGECLPKAYARGDDLVSRDGMLIASLFAGMALAIANVGAVHALAHVVGGLHHVGHGVANALLLPHVMEFNVIACPGKYANVAALLGESVEGLPLHEVATRGAVAVRRLLRQLGLPQRLRELDIPEDALEHVAQVTMETQGRIVVNNPRSMSLAEAKQILNNAY